MTTVATLIGLVSVLLASSGSGANSRFAISCVLGVGITIRTVFTLFLVPAPYTVVASQRASGEDDEISEGQQGAQPHPA